MDARFFLENKIEVERFLGDSFHFGLDIGKIVRFIEVFQAFLDTLGVEDIPGTDMNERPIQVPVFRVLLLFGEHVDVVDPVILQMDRPQGEKERQQQQQRANAFS